VRLAQRRRTASHRIISHSITSHHREKIMNFYSHPNTPRRRVLIASMTAALSLTATGHLWAATPKPANIPVATAAATKPARQCLTDLSAFQTQMQTDGHWRGGSGYGYGYPLYGYGYDAGMAAPAMSSANASGAAEYWRARPGYDVRTLLAAAQILAQRGQQASCEALLGETRQIYSRYAAALGNGHVPRDNPFGWRQAQLAAALPVAGQDVSYRSDQLIGTEVLNPKGDTLGSIDDLVLSPQTGKIAYLVIGRGGLFGINEKYVPVPWADFKATAGAKTLVLDTTKADMAAAPHVKEDRFSSTNDFDKQSQQIDAFWSTHLAK
jgi:sporulation protein YlmC with PRC-barrel domain